MITIITTTTFTYYHHYSHRHYHIHHLHRRHHPPRSPPLTLAQIKNNRYCMTRLPALVLEHSLLEKDPGRAMADSFVGLDKEVRGLVTSVLSCWSSHLNLFVSIFMLSLLLFRKSPLHYRGPVLSLLLQPLYFNCHNPKTTTSTLSHQPTTTPTTAPIHCHHYYSHHHYVHEKLASNVGSGTSEVAPYAGCTCVAVLMVGKELVVANAGDSRAVRI